MSILRTSLVSISFLATSLFSAAWANSPSFQGSESEFSSQSNLLLAQANPRAQQKFVNEFVSGIRTGCMRSAKPAVVKDLRKYCQCYATSFATRFTPTQLAVVNRAASSSNNAPAVINVMMAPEAQSCIKK
jgi:hypothetical protein